jgi:2-(1,2-epoxy-1,2-dihydrophenyl)acetyl-CoA isomerase
MPNVVEHHRDGAVAILTLNAPARRNAISLDTRLRLLELLRQCAADPACRAIVLAGAGGHFCSGGEVKPAGGADNAPDPARTRSNIGILHDVVRLLAGGPKPTVAAVQGSAFGAGMSLAAACDHVVVAPSARFCAAFGKVGLMADAGLMWSLPTRIGVSPARNLLLTARIVDAQEAMTLGLADEMAAEGQVLAHGVRAARDLSRLAPLAVAAMKDVMARGPASLESVIAAESDLQPRLTLTQDYVEGRAAFEARRAPRFRGV